jgi:hypothetical protein
MDVTMKCHKAHKNIYLFEELSERDRREVLKHVEECRQCGELFESVREMSLLTKRAQTPIEPTDSFRLTQKIMAGVVVESKRTRSWFEVFLNFSERSEVTWAMVAGSILLVSVFATQFSISDGDSISQGNRPIPQKAIILNVSSFKEVLNEKKTSVKTYLTANCEDPISTSIRCVKERIEKLRSINNNGK